MPQGPRSQRMDKCLKNATRENPTAKTLATRPMDRIFGHHLIYSTPCSEGIKEPAAPSPSHHKKELHVTRVSGTSRPEGNIIVEYTSCQRGVIPLQPPTRTAIHAPPCHLAMSTHTLAESHSSASAPNLPLHSLILGSRSAY